MTTAQKKDKFSHKNVSHLWQSNLLSWQTHQKTSSCASLSALQPHHLTTYVSISGEEKETFAA